MAGRRLTVEPCLASWDAISTPSQQRIAAYLAHVRDMVSDIPSSTGRLALRLDVGLPTTAPLFGAGGDLDNYLYPVTSHLGADRFVTAWASKGHGESAVAVADAVPALEPLGDDWLHFDATTTASAQSRAWKEQLAAQLQPLDTGSGPVELQVAYRLSGRRNWAALWKPTLDALGAILGEGPRPFHPRDDRITHLGLHRTIDETIGWAIDLSIWVRRV